MNHYCHMCERIVNVDILNDVIHCRQCRGGFVEQVAAHPFEDMQHGDFVQNIINQLTGPQHLGEEHLDRIDGLPASPRFRLIVDTFGVGGDIMGRFNHPAGDFGGYGDFALGERNFNDILAQLMEQADQEQTARVSPEDILRLPVTQVNKKQLKNGIQCVTCMEPFVLDERVVALECEHIFHRQCLEPWLRLHNTCPICRSVVDPKKWPANSTFDIWELD